MKKTIYIITILLVAALLFACAPQEKDIFGDSSANRMAAALTADEAVLKSAEHGWLMEYYPASGQIYGGYNVAAFFYNNDTVEFISELDYTLISSSTYKLKQSAGPVLSFDTYSKVFHLFSDPDSKVSGVGKDGKGMEGEFEFLILKAQKDSVILKGKKTGNRIIMTPIAEGVNPQTMLKTFDEASEKMTFRLFDYEENGNKARVSVSFRTLTFNYQNSEGSMVSEKVAYIQTFTGYKLYKPIKIFNTVITEFKFIEGAEPYFVAANDESITLTPVYPPLNEQFVYGDWFFKYSGVGAFGKQYWDYTKKNGLDPEGEELLYAYMGTVDGKYGFAFNSSGFGGVLHFNYTISGANKVKLSFAGTAAGNGQWYFQNAAFNYLIAPLGSSAAPRTFTITADNEKIPTWLKLTDDSNPTNTFVMSGDVVMNPYTQ